MDAGAEMLGSIAWADSSSSPVCKLFTMLPEKTTDSKIEEATLEACWSSGSPVAKLGSLSFDDLLSRFCWKENQQFVLKILL